MEHVIAPLNASISAMTSQKEALSEEVADMSIEVDELKQQQSRLDDEQEQYEADMKDLTDLAQAEQVVRVFCC